MKRHVRLLSILMVMVVFASCLTPVRAAYANDAIQTNQYVINISGDECIRIEEDELYRKAIYYVNGEEKQIAIFYKESGEILYTNLEHGGGKTQKERGLSDGSEEVTKKYTVDEFLIEAEVDEEYTNGNLLLEQRNTRSTNFSLLNAKAWNENGITYSRYLYGYSDQRQYRQNSWHFGAGVAVAVISAASPLLAESLSKIISIAGSAGGVTLSALTVQEWVKDSFWVYRFEQTLPTKINAICNGDFVYKKEHKIEISGDDGYWETLEEKSSWEINKIREDILTNPGYYI